MKNTRHGKINAQNAVKAGSLNNKKNNLLLAASLVCLALPINNAMAEDSITPPIQ